MTHPHVKHPPPGATFALPDHETAPEVKRVVLEVMAGLPWQRYLAPSAALLTSSRWNFADVGDTTIYARGSEQALYDYLLASGAQSLLVPRFSYPGYARVARRLGIALCEYATEDEARTRLAQTAGPCALVWVHPGNPVTVPLSRRFQEECGARVRIVVDAAYDRPWGEAFERRVTAALHRGQAVMFSLSKVAALAGARFGGVICPEQSLRAVPADPNWDALMIAVLEVLQREDAVAAIMAADRRQRDLRDAMAAALEALSVRIVEKDSSLFVTVGHSPMLAGLLPRLTLKTFADAGTTVHRIDVSIENLRRIGEAAGG